MMIIMMMIIIYQIIIFITYSDMILNKEPKENKACITITHIELVEIYL